MFRPHRRTLIVCLLLLQMFLSPVTSAQPAPPPPQCTNGQVLDPTHTRCVEPGANGGQQGGADDDPVVNPPDPGVLAGLYLRHWVCSTEFNPTQVWDIGGGRVQGCGLAGSPAYTYTISVDQTAVASATLTAPDGSFAGADLPGLDGEPIPAGWLTIATDQVPDFAMTMVYCDPTLNGQSGQAFEATISSGIVASFQAEADWQYRCDIYNVSTVAVDKPYRLDLGGGSITIGILSVLCPAGTTLNDDLDRSCTEGASNVPFMVQSETENLAANVTDGNGTLFFEDVRDGNLAITETVPAGYGAPFVRCTWYSAISGTMQIDPHILYGSGFLLPLDPGDEIECTFYNMPAAGPDNGPSIFVQYASCGLNSGVENDTTLDEAYANPNCYGPVFSIVLSVNFAGATVTSDSSSADGQLFFTKLPVADGDTTYTLSKDVSDQRPLRNAFCDRGPTSGPYEIVPVTVEDTQRFSVDAGVDTLVRCTVFVDDGLFLTPEAGTGNDQLAGNGNNVGENNPNAPGNTIDPNQKPADSGAGQVKLAGPSLNGSTGSDSTANPPSDSAANPVDPPSSNTGGGNTVTVQFWNCPDGIATTAQQEDLLFTCTEDGTNRDVATTYDGATHNETIPGYGSWMLSGTSFALGIAPQPSSVWCSATGSAGSQFPEEVETTDGVLGLSVNEPGTIIYCDWFTASSGG